VVPWATARDACYEAGQAARVEVVELPLIACDGMTLAEDLQALTDLPAFATSSVDGWAVKGRAPWQIIGHVLAGMVAAPLASLDQPSEESTGTHPRSGICVQIATGAMVPADAEAILRVEDSTITDGHVTGVPRSESEWRLPGDEARLGDVLVAAGTVVTPAIIGLAAASGHDMLRVSRRPVAATLIFGDELLTSGPQTGGRIRDSLGPQVPAWMHRLGATSAQPAVIGPIEDTLDAHVAAIREAQATGADIILTTGGTMHGPVDHLHGALSTLGATYVVNTVAVRPGFPMLLATVPNPAGGTTLLAGLPGNPQSAIVAIVSLVVPALAGLSGRSRPRLPTVRLGTAIPGRGEFTHLSLVYRDEAGDAHPLGHAASSMLRGLAQAVGFAVIVPGGSGSAGDDVPLVPLPIFAGEQP
jgi:molybdopterin molybdotransferase